MLKFGLWHGNNSKSFCFCAYTPLCINMINEQFFIRAAQMLPY